MPPKPTCICGACRKCKHREYMRNYYRAKAPGERRRLFVDGRDAERVRAADRARYEAGKADPEYMEKRRARWSVANAIRDGRLTRENCEVCGAGDAQAHHDDYSKPLEVRWLCAVHHAAEHAPEAAWKDAA